MSADYDRQRQAEGVTLTDQEAALLYVVAGHKPQLPFGLVARLQDAYARNANAAPPAPVN